MFPKFEQKLDTLFVDLVIALEAANIHIILQTNFTLTARLASLTKTSVAEESIIQITAAIILELFFQRVKDEFVTSAIHNGARLSQTQLQSISIEPNQIQFIDGNQYGIKVLYKTNIYVARTLVYYHVDFRSFYRNAYFHSRLNSKLFLKK